MRETCIDYVAGENFATYYTSDFVYIARLRKKIEQYPDEIQVLMDDPEFGMSVRVPKKWFREPAPPRRVTDEQKAASAERFAKYREAKNAEVAL